MNSQIEDLGRDLVSVAAAIKQARRPLPTIQEVNGAAILCVQPWLYDPSRAVGEGHNSVPSACRGALMMSGLTAGTRRRGREPVPIGWECRWVFLPVERRCTK